MTAVARWKRSERRSISWQSKLDWGLLLTGLALLTVTEVYQPIVPIGLLFTLSSFGVRAWRRGRLAPRTGLEIPWVLFLGSGALATYISYDQPAAFLQFSRYIASATWFYALCDSRQRIRRWNAWGFVLLGTALAVYWPLQHDFAAQPAKFAVLNAIGLWLNQHLPSLKFETLTGPAIHPNVAAGALSLAVPFAALTIFQQRKAGRAPLAVLSSLALAFILFSLLLTGSRGAWIGVALSAGFGMLVWMQRRWFSAPDLRWRFWVIILVAGISMLFVAQATIGLERLVGQIPDPNGSLRSRTVVWTEGALLARDYFFTGIGFQAYWLVNPLYTMLVHFPYLPHAHNTFLEVWIEQGVLGALGLAWALGVWLSWGWRAITSRRVLWLGWAGLAALVVSLAHGIVDDILTYTRLIPLAGLVLGFSWSAVQHAPPLPWPRPVRYAALGTAALALVIGILSWRGIASAWYANLGALNQSLLEISRYDPAHFDRPTLDQIRRELNLSVVETSFQRALALNPNNLTARQRLAQIALSRGDYAAAEQYIAKAWQHGNLDPVTRLLYGDALVAQGKPEQAAAVVRGLTWASGRLLFQAYYRYWLHQDYMRTVLTSQAVLLLEPGEPRALDLFSKGQNKLANP